MKLTSWISFASIGAGIFAGTSVTLLALKKEIFVISDINTGLIITYGIMALILLFVSAVFSVKADRLIELREKIGGKNGN